MAKDKTKPCVKCGAVDRNTRGDCRPCAKAAMKTWQKAHPREFRAGIAAWRKAHPKKAVGYNRAWARANPERKRLNQASHMLKRTYGITQAEYDCMYAKQNGLCAICHQPETALDRTGDRVKALAVDHCHKTNQIRGLLCHACNNGIGCLKDSPILLAAAILYLKPGLAVLEAVIALLVGWLQALKHPK